MDATAVAEIPYKIFQLDFSPSGSLGFAVGVSDNINPTPILCINTSYDGGETWTEVLVDKYLRSSGYLTNLTSPAAISVPSENVIYILQGSYLIKCTNY
jgi:hypothetical protein